MYTPSADHLPDALSSLPTPLVLVDQHVVSANILAMQQWAGGLGASLWPHFKSHQTEWILAQQVAAGAGGITVASIKHLEAVRARHPVPVLLAAMPQFDPATHAAIRRAADLGRVLFTADSVAAVDALAKPLAGRNQVELLLEVEIGTGRTGAMRDEISAIAARATQHGLTVRGVFAYPGSAYLPGAAEAAAGVESDALNQAAALLRVGGHPCTVLSAGSTPTAKHYRTGTVSMVRPGTYVFGDRQQLGLGSASPATIGLSVLATVISRRGNRIVTDAGGRALGRDHRSWLAGYGQLAEAPSSVVTAVFDHHSVIELTDYDARPSDRVRIIPNNANSVVALHRELIRVTDGRWQRMRSLI